MSKPKTNRPDPRRAVRSFGHAGRGILHVLRTEQNVQIHLVAALIVVGLAFYLRIGALEFAVLLLAIGIVITAEVINTVIEDLLDLIHPGTHPVVGRIKDALAGAVLIAAIIALFVGALVFLPYLFAALP
jgi:diacylglycerol kinase (ATP)